MKTFLYQKHVEQQAKIVDFEGWEMPLHYQSVLKEHEWVRNKAGLFDISHMGKISIQGKDAEAFLDFLTVNYVKKLSPNQAQYSILCNSNGGCVDDILVYKESSTSFFIVVNASNREKVLKHLLGYSQKFSVQIRPNYEGQGILAIQGPNSKDVLKPLFKEVEKLRFMHFTHVNYQGKKMVVSRTGYTGELGFEIYGPEKEMAALWDELLKDERVAPIGLAARDILRLEMGYALYGHEIAEDILPTESVASWVVRLDKPNFLGQSALKNAEQKRYAYGVILDEKAIARDKTAVLVNGVQRGRVTSGGYSPSLRQSIALVLLDQKLTQKDSVSVSIRGREILSLRSSLPFLKKN